MINASDSKKTNYILNKKSGIPLVLIHGVGLNYTIFEPQIDAFDNTVLAYDISVSYTHLTLPTIYSV